MNGFRLKIFVALAILSAAVFVRLGIWQLHRLGERRARNALVVARLDSAELDARRIPRDTALARFRRIRVSGTPDYDHQLIYAARNFNGSPGVNFLTPIRIAGTDTAVIVNRGWVYAPDGATVDEAKWRDRDTTFVGYAEEFPSVKGSSYSGKPRVIAHLGYATVASALPYPISPIYVVALGDSAIAADRVARLSIPPLDEGPHFSYALQWFAFAVVALVGAGIVIRQARRDGPSTYEPRDATIANERR